MKTYYLVHESGPRHMKTFVSVPNLLGCMANGPTTDEALANAPDAIREYLRFLKRHGENVDPDAPFETEVLQAIISKTFAGNGSFTMEADREPLTAEEVETYACRLEWMADELIEIVSGLGVSTLTADGPEHSKRAIRKIVQHITAASAAELATIIKGMSNANRIAREAQEDEGDPIDQLRRLDAIMIPRLREMTDDERAAERMAGANLVTARRMMRGLLEHRWEHLREIQRRIK